jgi:predicted NAD/FAD-dependent oxidoreductase
MSTRRNKNLSFDHGAQYFTARDPRFLRHVMAWRERGLVRPWNARIATIGTPDNSKKRRSAERFVAIPGMNAICKELAGELGDCRFDWAVDKIKQLEEGWLLTSDQDQSIECDALVCTTPPEQAGRLLADSEVDELISGVQMMPCWSLMLVLEKPLLEEHDAAFINQGPLSWVSSQPSRPGRPTANAWVLHASPEWSLKHLEKPADEVRDLLLEAARQLPLVQAFTVETAIAHRWRYALAKQPLTCGVIWLEPKKLALAGDWCNGSRVEGAFLSGAAAAGRIMASHDQRHGDTA